MPQKEVSPVPTWMKPRPLSLPEAFVAAVGSQPLAELLYRRGFTTPEAATAYLSGGIDVDAPGLPDLHEGVDYVVQAILTGQRICVYGDYDTDGTTSTALLVDLLRRLGADVTYYVPNRFRDGYGMNAAAINMLADEGTALILTCDCGVRNLEEVVLARRLGMTVVVTDHHELGPVLPDADAVINPKRLPEGHPSRMLPGVGTAYLLARQILRALDRDPEEADRWLDLVATGIIADVVPLSGANRELARRGLARLNTSPCLGLQALMGVAGLQAPITEEDVAFQLVPRINAAGRLADASVAVRLLLAIGATEAQDLAEELDRLNQERKRLTAAVAEAAAKEVKPGVGAILLYRPEWHEGVLGIAAGKLAEEYGVPTLLMARKQGGKVLVGSARALEGFVLHEALEACSEHLLKYGGHASAAGFSLLEDRFPAFRAAMLEEARRRSHPEAAGERPRVADLALPMAEVDRDLYDALRRAAPFGEGNPVPLLFSPGVKLLSARPIGPGEKHLRLVFRDGEQSLAGIWWGAGALALELEPQTVDLFYHVGLNRWNGQELLQVAVEQLAPPGVAVEEPAEADEPQAKAAEVAEADRVAEAPPQPLVVTRPVLIDLRGYDPHDVLAEFPDALCFAEGRRTPTGDGEDGLPVVDRYGLRPAADLVMLSPIPSPRLLDEAIARTGTQRLVMAWPTAAPSEEERFLPVVMALVAAQLSHGPYVTVEQLAVQTGELEITVRKALEALAESGLLAIDEDDGSRLRLRPRTDGRGIRESHALRQMRQLVGESRAFRRFLRSGSPAAIDRTIYAGQRYS